MRHSLVIAAILGLATPALAQTTAPGTSTAPATAAPASCTLQVTEKKLAGAAKTSFMTKCEKDAAAACDAQAIERKLAGAARNSFTKKCVTDAVGT